MQTITLITGNAHKLKEWQRMLGDAVDLQHTAIDLIEIQSMDSQEIISHKVRQAYDQMQVPVVVEDVSFGIDKFDGLPGPFIKFFEQKLGPAAMYQLAGEESPAEAICTIGYYDGEREIIVTGRVHGTAVAARGTGFGFDAGFQPDGSDITYGQMTPEQKDSMSHRRLAINELLKRLSEL